MEESGTQTRHSNIPFWQQKGSWRRVPTWTYWSHHFSLAILEIPLMHIHASTASTEHKTVILRQMILSNYDTTELDRTLFAAIWLTPDAFSIFWPKDLEDCSFPSQPHRGPCEALAVWDDKVTTLHSQNETAKVWIKVSIYDYLQIKLPWFYSFSIKLWRVRWRPVSMNWVMKRNGNPREPTGQN